jgi:hypothetical protein
MWREKGHARGWGWAGGIDIAISVQLTFLPVACIAQQLHSHRSLQCGILGSTKGGHLPAAGSEAASQRLAKVIVRVKGPQACVN